MDLFKRDDRVSLADTHLFDDCVREVFDDLKQSDGFARFLAETAKEGNGATTLNLSAAVAGPSDSSLS